MTGPLRAWTSVFRCENPPPCWPNCLSHFNLVIENPLNFKCQCLKIVSEIRPEISKYKGQCFTNLNYAIFCSCNFLVKNGYRNSLHLGPHHMPTTLADREKKNGLWVPWNLSHIVDIARFWFLFANSKKIQSVKEIYDHICTA